MAIISIFDLDRTVSRRDTFRLFLAGILMTRASRWWQAPALVGAAILFMLRRRDNSWLKQQFLTRIAGGMPADALEARGTAFAAFLRRRFIARDALAEIALRRSEGALLVLATASPEVYVRPLAESLDISHVICSELEADADGRLTGALCGGNCYGPEKLRRIDEFRMRLGANWSDVTVYSDHHTDLPLLAQAGRGYAVNPSRAFTAQCRRQGIAVVRWH